MANHEINEALLVAIADEGERLGEHPDFTYEEWGNQFIQVLGLYGSAASVVGAAGRRIEELKGVGIGLRDPDTAQAAEGLRTGAQAEALNARMFILRMMAMGFDWLEAQEAGRIPLP